MSNLLVTARMASPLAGDAPQLDSLLEAVLARSDPNGLPPHMIGRNLPAPSQGSVSIPIERQWLGGFLVAKCSAPILSASRSESVVYIHKKLAVEHSRLLHGSARTVVNTTNTWTKSFRLPLRTRDVESIAWFAVGSRVGLSDAIRPVTSIGKKKANGFGRVASWEITEAGEDCSWFAPTEHGPMLMRVLPAGGWLPPGLIGARPDFGAATPPYFHPERYCEIVVPC